MSKPLVTIITATYNLIEGGRKETFLQAVESVKNQTYDNIEHLIIDGGSKDGTVELIKSTGLKYISEPDDGIYFAFNKAVELASGKYINFLNSDDFFNNNDAVRLSVDALEKHNADFSYATASILTVNDKIDTIFKPHIYDFFSRMPFCHQTMFTKTSVIKREGMFDLAFKSASDYDLIIRLILGRYNFVEVKKNIVSFRTTGMSHVNIQASIMEQVAIFKKIYSKYADLSNNEYEQIAITGRIPKRLFMAFKLSPWLHFRYFKVKLKNIRKSLFSCRISLKNMEKSYLYILDKSIFGVKDEKSLSLNEYIEHQINIMSRKNAIGVQEE